MCVGCMFIIGVYFEGQYIMARLHVKDYFVFLTAMWSRIGCNHHHHHQFYFLQLVAAWLSGNTGLTLADLKAYKLPAADLVHTQSSSQQTHTKKHNRMKRRVTDYTAKKCWNYLHRNICKRWQYMTHIVPNSWLALAVKVEYNGFA